MIKRDERPVEYGFVFKHLARWYPKNILDVGTGKSFLPAFLRSLNFDVMAIDNYVDYWGKRVENEHFEVMDGDICRVDNIGLFDMITCISTLEHIENYKIAVKNMTRMLAPGGILVLTFPYREDGYEENVYKLVKLSFNPRYICRSLDAERLDGLAEENNLVCVDKEYWQLWTGRLWRQGDWVFPPVQTNRHEEHQLMCVAMKNENNNGRI